MPVQSYKRQDKNLLNVLQNVFKVNNNNTRTRSTHVVLVSMFRVTLFNDFILTLNLNLSATASLLLSLSKVLLVEVIFALEYSFDP